MWVDTADLPTNDGHPYFERLNRVLADSGFDAFVEELCAAFYADRLGRPSLRPVRYFRMLFIGYFEGLTSSGRAGGQDCDGTFKPGPYAVTAFPARQHLDACCPARSTDQPQDTKSVVGRVRTDRAAARLCSQSSRCDQARRSDHTLSWRPSSRSPPSVSS